MNTSLSLLLRVVFLSSLCFHVLAKPILIACDSNCGCYTETGIPVDCKFVKSGQVAVLRGTDQYSGRGEFFVFSSVNIRHIPEHESPPNDGICQKPTFQKPPRFPNIHRPLLPHRLTQLSICKLSIGKRSSKKYYNTNGNCAYA